jgi:hypothetical protein
MTYHILNGDVLAGQLKETDIKGQFIICAECLIDGDLTGDTLQQFWLSRANYIADNYKTTTDRYYHKCVSEFEKIIDLPVGTEVCLWFENDLFCQANMWFVISLLFKGGKENKIFRVFPAIVNKADLWKGFGISDTKMLEQAYRSRVQFSEAGLILGESLWNAYKVSDFDKLIELSKQESQVFEYLGEVCQAHIDRFPTDNSPGRPDRAVKEIMQNKSKEFEEVFSEFSDKHGIYGFGDSQVKVIYDRN